MELSQDQKLTICQIENDLSEYLWEQTYYVDPNTQVHTLFNQGVELYFEVKVIPYVGKEHPEYKD